MSLYFVCSHLASRDKEGDELRRNGDVTETIKSTQFSRICKNINPRATEKIIDHEHITIFSSIFLGLAYKFF